MEESHDRERHTEPRNDLANFVAASVYGAVEFICDAWNALNVNQGGERAAARGDGAFNYEVAFGEEEPSSGIVAFLCAAGEAALVQSKLAKPRIVGIVDLNYVNHQGLDVDLVVVRER